jgi:hypothetical protein
MTPNESRELALSFPEAIESAHMHHPDFRYPPLSEQGFGNGKATAGRAARIHAQ